MKSKIRKNESLGDFSARRLANICNKDGSANGSYSLKMFHNINNKHTNQ